MKADKAFYEQYAKNYPDDLVVRGSQLAKIKELIDYKGKIGLDVGSANGALVFELVKNGAKKMYGIDLAEEFIKKSTETAKKRKISNVEFKEADAKELPYPDNFFDFVICTEVLEHVPDFRVAIEEIERVLKPGGQFVITTPNTLNPAEILHQCKHLIFYVLKNDPITHINIFFLITIKKYFQWAKKLKITSLHFVLPFLPKKFVRHEFIDIDLKAGDMLRPISFDIVVYGEK